MNISGFGSSLNQFAVGAKRTQKIFEQLSSGKKVNSAKDDPSTLALASSLESSVRSLETVNRGISYTQGALQTASGSLNQSSQDLQRARELAVQAANGTLSSQDRSNLQSEFGQLVENVDQSASQTSYGSTNLLDGSFNKSVTTGTNGQSKSISVGNASASALGLSGLDISTQSGAEDAIEAIDSALASVNNEQANIGAQQNALEYTANANSVQAENLAAAKSAAADTDYAQALSELGREQVLQQAQLKAFKYGKDAKENLAKSLLVKA